MPRIPVDSPDLGGDFHDRGQPTDPHALFLVLCMSCRLWLLRLQTGWPGDAVMLRDLLPLLFGSA
jgi:hypothetical protein